MKKALSLFLVVVSGSMVASAQANAGINNLFNLLRAAQDFVAKLVPFFIALAVAVFFFYLIKFIVKGNESGADKDVSMKGMGYSILAIFVMVALWGVIAMLTNVLGVDPNITKVRTPCVPGTPYPAGDPCA